MDRSEVTEEERNQRERALKRLGAEIEKARTRNPLVIARALGSEWATDRATIWQLVTLDEWARKPGGISDTERVVALTKALGVGMSFWDTLPTQPSEGAGAEWAKVTDAALSQAFVHGAARIFSLLKRELEARDLLPPTL